MTGISAMSPMPIAAVTTSMKKIGMRAPTALLRVAEAQA